ncbi:MAG: glycine cleavage system protein GcvH [Deltaproteobacteria bacterium]|nr:glycine cleavage system protein GcvH [Candidatus Zymogenaceae bacterium]
MSDIPKDLKYTEEHEWVRMEGSVGVCGITDYAQEMLTDIVYVELPEVDIEIGQGEQVAVVESVKAVSDVYAPLTGTIVEINEELEDSPEMVNDDPYGEGWIFKIEIENDDELEELMDAEEYAAFIESMEEEE